MRILYHGSDHIIERPKFGAGRAGNDYGRAFYCTFDENLAGEWACSHMRDGYINCYEFDDSGLDIFDFECGSYHILNWLAVLLDNRNIRLRMDVANTARDFVLDRFLPDYRDFDVIQGYRADDSFFGFANDFLNNSISLNTLEHLMKLGQMGRQFALSSREAYSRIGFTGAHIAGSDIFYPAFKKRDEDARNAAMLMRRPEPAGIYILDIMRGDWDDGDSRLQRFIC